MTQFNAMLAQGMEEQRRRDRANTATREDNTAEYERRKQAAWAEWNTCLRQATLQDYLCFLRAHLAAGNTPRSFWDRPFPVHHTFVAVKDFHLYALYGSAAVDIIIAKGVKCLGGTACSSGNRPESGHCSIYDINDGSARGPVHIYSDTLEID